MCVSKLKQPLNAQNSNNTLSWQSKEQEEQIKIIDCRNGVKVCQLYDISWKKLLLHFPLLTFQGRACFIPRAFVDITPSAWLSFHPSYFQLLKYSLKAFHRSQITNPSELSKMPLFPTPKSYVLNSIFT